MNDYDTYWEGQRRTILSATVTLILVAADLVIYLVEIIGKWPVYETYALDTLAVATQGEYYRLITAMFMHASIPHLLSNMAILLLLGAGVERELGHMAYGLLYILGGLAGNVVTVVWDSMTGGPTMSIGASGAVFSVIGGIVVIFIREKGQLVARRGLAIRLGLMVLYSLGVGFGQSEINNAAHVGGFVAGVLLTGIYTALARRRYSLAGWI